MEKFTFEKNDLELFAIVRSREIYLLCIIVVYNILYVNKSGFCVVFLVFVVLYHSA